MPVQIWDWEKVREMVEQSRKGGEVDQFHVQTRQYATGWEGWVQYADGRRVWFVIKPDAK